MFQRIIKWMKGYRTPSLQVRVIEIRERLALEQAARDLHMHRTDLEAIRGKAL